MTQKWNLQDIKPATNRKTVSTKKPVAMTSTPKTAAAKPERTRKVPQKTPVHTESTKKGSWKQVLAIALVIFSVTFLVSILTGGTELTVHPKFREPNVNSPFTAYSEAAADQLSYEIMTLEAVGERQVQATGKETVQSQAEGTIVIYNNHQNSPLRLVTNTRFESPDGLIFRVKDSVNVPGYTTDADGARVPGSVTAEVFAEEIGEQYNVEPTRFSVPGFAGSAEFDNVYAESLTKFTGGFDGPKFIVEDEELETAKQALHTELRNSLLERINTEKPAGFVVFDSAVTFTYESLPTMAYGDNMATIKEKVYLRIPLFAETDFANYLAAATVPGYEGEDVKITDFSVIEFNYTSATTTSSNIASLNSLTFDLQGRPQIVWVYDAEALKSDLLQKNRTALSSVLSGYPAIDKAEAAIKPFWKQTFPKKVDSIKIVEVLE